VSVRLTLSYRGAAYAGWQRQDNARTVQEVVEEALAGLLGRPAGRASQAGGGPDVRVVGASRTDAGVHARGQAAHLEPVPDLPPRALVHGVNHWLPEDVRVLAAERVPEGFHARKHAAAKVYSYRLSRAPVLSPLDAPYAVRVDPRIDPAALARAAAHLPGAHDFTAFALAGGAHRQPVRRLFRAEWREAGEELCFRVAGEGFLRGMVRALVGTMIEVGLGRRSEESFAALLAGRPREEAGPTAPAHGLVLERVLYPPAWGGSGLDGLDLWAL
jgi:tRNA pseudouridine38-40 synthase